MGDSQDHVSWFEESPPLLRLSPTVPSVHAACRKPLLRKQHADILEHVFRMRAEPESHVGVAQHHLTLRVEHDRDTLRVLAVLRFGGAERERERLVAVGPDLVRELLLLRPREVLLGRVESRADDRDAEVLELLVAVAEPATFDRSTPGRSRWVEPHHGGVPEKGRLRAWLPVLIHSLELGRRDGRRRTLAVQRRCASHRGYARAAREKNQGNHA